MQAGDVWAILGARVDNSGFLKYDTALGRAVASAGKAEAAQRRYDAALARSNANMAAAGRVAKTGLAAGMVGVTAAIAGSIKKAADFEQQMSELGAVSKASAADMARLKKSAMDMGAATKFSALEAAQAQTALAKGGLTTSQIVGGGLKASLSLAAAGNMELNAAAETVVNTMNQFSLGADKASNVADSLAKAADMTTVDVTDLALALRQGGGVAAMAGASFDETVAALSALADASVRGSDAGTSLKSFFLNIATASPKARKAMDGLGLSLFDAKGQLKSMPAIADNLRDSFGELTQEQFLNKAGVIAGTDAARALFAIYKAGPEGMRGYIEAQQQAGYADEVAAKRQDNLKGKLEQLRGAVETAGIALGTRLLPVLTAGVERAADAINEAVQGGSLDSFADGLIAGGRTAVQVVGDIAGAIQSLASAVGPVAGGLARVADSLGLFSATGIEAAVAAFAGFKVAQTVAPMVATLASNVALLRTAPSKGALAADIMGMVNPYTAAAVAVAGLAAGLVILASRQSTAAGSAERHAATLRSLKAAMDDVSGAERSDARAQLEAKQARLDAADAQRDYTRAVKEHGKNSDEAYRAELRAEQAALRAKEAAAAATKATEDRGEAIKESLRKAREAEEKAERERDRVDRKAPKAATEYRAQAEKQYAEAVRNRLQAEAQAATSTLSRDRLMERSTQITAKQAEGVNEFVKAVEKLPREQRTKLLLEADAGAMSKVGMLLKTGSRQVKATVKAVIEGDAPVRVKIAAIDALAKGVSPARVKALVFGTAPASVQIAALDALAKGVSPAKVKALVTGDRPAKEKIREMAAAVAAVPSSKTVQVSASVDWGGLNNFIAAVDEANRKARRGKKRAAGRGPVGQELALVGEGSNPREAVVSPGGGWAMVTNGPMVMGLPADAYVIPEDPMKRGRSMGLLAMLAEDLGLRGFKEGKKPAQSLGLPNPDKLTPTTLALSELEKAEGDARKSLNDATTRVHDLPEKIKAAKKRVNDTKDRNAKTPATKHKKDRDLKDAREDLAKLERSLVANKKAEPRRRQEWKGLKARLDQARKYQAAITKAETMADTAATEMATANAAGNRAAWDAARGRRGEALKVLQQLLTKAQATLKNKDSQAAAEIAKLVAENAGAIHTDETAEFNPAVDEAVTGADRDALNVLDRDVALAGLTKPVGDDADASTARRDFLEGLLATAQAQGRSAPVITELAGMVKQARDDVATLTQQDKAPDLQAQIEQANRRAELAESNARLNQQFLATALTGGDIGTGGSGSAPSITIQTLHPGDPRTLAAIGAAAVGGMSLQGGRTSPRTSVA